MAQNNIKSIQHLINQNSADRSMAIMRHTYRQITWDELFETLIRLDKELDLVYHNWLADEKLICCPIAGLHDQGGENYFWDGNDWKWYKIPSDWNDANEN